MQKEDIELCGKFLKRLREYPIDRWLYFGSYFNKWEVPSEFYDLIPAWARTDHNRWCELIRQVHNPIHYAFTEKEFLYHHNVVTGRMTDESFEYWYENIGCKSLSERTEVDGNKYYAKEEAYQKLRWWDDRVAREIKKLLPKNP